MAAEVLEIQVRQKGAKAVVRDIQMIGTEANKAATAMQKLQTQLTKGAGGFKATGAAAGAAGAQVGAFAAKTAAASAALSQFGIGATIVGGALMRGVGGPLKDAIKIAGEFEYALNQAGVRFEIDRTSDTFKRVHDTAAELGRTTIFTATQVAGGFKFLAQAGFEADEAIKAIPETLKIAAAGQLDLARASDITTNILKGFRLENEELAPAVDTLVATFTSSNVSIEQLAQSFRKVGPVAVEFGQTFADVAGSVGALGDAGIQSEEAGTALRRIFINLEQDINKSNSILRKAGVDIRDSAGNWRPLIEIMGEISEKVKEPGDRIDLFAARALAASGVLTNASEQGLRDYVNTLVGPNSLGRAAEVASATLEGFKGATVELVSALEGLKIKIAESGLLEWVTKMVDKLTLFVRRVADLPDPILAAIGATAAFVGVLGSALFWVGLFSIALTAMNVTTWPIWSMSVIGATRALIGFIGTAAVAAGPISILIGLFAVIGKSLYDNRNELIKVGDEYVTTASLAEESWDSLTWSINYGLQQSADAIWRFIDGPVDELGMAAKGAATEINVATVLEGLIGLVSITLRVIMEAIKTTFNALVQWMKSAGQLLMNVPSMLAAAASGDFGRLGQLMGESFGDDFIKYGLGQGFSDRIAEQTFQGALDAKRLLGAMGDSDLVARAQARDRAKALARGNRDTNIAGGGKGNKGGGGGGGGPGATPGNVPIEVAERYGLALEKLLMRLDPVIEAERERIDIENTLANAAEARFIVEEEIDGIMQQLAHSTYKELIAVVEPLNQAMFEQEQHWRMISVYADQAGVSQEEQARIQGKLTAHYERSNLSLKVNSDKLGGMESLTKGASIGFQDFSDSLGNSFTATRDVVTTSLNAVGGAITDFVTTGKMNFKDFARSLLSDITSIITNLLIMQAIKAASQAFGAGAADGATVTPAQSGATVGQRRVGDTFLVGEKGPELFTPSTTGRIIPNDQSFPQQGPPEVNVSVVNVDDPRNVMDALGTREGEQAVLNIIQRNRSALREV